MKPRYLTKTRFKLAMECPTKLFYTGKPEYANQKNEDPFLIALADGGFQVGELAKQYFPGGYDITTRDYDEALDQTNDLLKMEKVVIFEAAFRFNNLFIRADIVVKNGDHIDLIEVKAKSFDAGSDNFFNRTGSIVSRWQSYLYDVAFQKHVVTNALPNCSLTAYLMMADKLAMCPTDGLNQKFKIVTDEDGRKSVAIKELNDEDLASRILCKVNVEDCCDVIYNIMCKTSTFTEYVDYLSNHYLMDKKIAIYPSAACKNCEFQATEGEIKSGLRTGLQECWKESLGWQDSDFLESTVLDIWDFRKKDKYFEEGRIKITQICEEDISPQDDGKSGLSRTQRQWLQILKEQNGDNKHWIDKDNLRRQMDQWIYPLHFIDFETAMVAIPFNKGRHPYEGIAFQYSHHVVHENGYIEHYGQYLNTTPGLFPNYDFIRSLKKELEQDKGSIFRYAAHENTYLSLIYHQLQQDPDHIPDREELCEFIRSIIHSEKGLDKWVGNRDMIDMLTLVKRYYYDPFMEGSNSIKQVLPAILNSSAYLKSKYSMPIYGARGGIPSHNYTDWQWIEYENGRVVDPYTLLPKMFQDISDKNLALLNDSDELKDGGAALTAYARMQFEEMSEYERGEITQALLKYCELDTLAMVMIYEGWRDLMK